MKKNKKRLEIRDVIGASEHELWAEAVIRLKEAKNLFRLSNSPEPERRVVEMLNWLEGRL